MFATRLKELRGKLGLTQKEFALKMHVSTSTVAMWEVEKREPDFATLCKMADMFGVTTDYLVGHVHIEDIQQQQRLEVNKSDTKDIGAAFTTLLIEAGWLASPEDLTVELKENAMRLIRAAIAFQQNANKKQ
jgi:transcriptional regulator with XRE-family HTH domain